MGPTEEGTHVEYAVQVQRLDRPDAEWFHRFGWFPETDSVDGRNGLARARENLPHALADFPTARIVQRTASIRVVE